MHIGVDGGCWGNRRGYGRFLRELMEAVARNDRANTYTVFLDADSYDQFQLNGNFRPVLVRTGKSIGRSATADGRRSVRDLLEMSRASAREKLDLFFFSSVYSYFPLLRRVPVVLGVHDTIADRNPAFSFASRRQEIFWRWKVRLALAQADTILTVSAYSARCLRELLKIPAERIRVMYEAASPQFRPIDSSQPAQPYILYAGGISPNKNLAGLLRAYHQAESRRRGVRLVLVGDYQSDGFKGCYAQLAGLIRDLRMESEVTFTGYVPDDELRLLYSRASVFVMPSFDEGFGLPALEAMACGVPVIVSTGNSLTEVVGEAGIAVDPADPAQLARAIDRVLADEAFSTLLRRRSLNRAAEFSWDASARSLLQIFEDTVRGRRA